METEIVTIHNTQIEEPTAPDMPPLRGVVSIADHRFFEGGHAYFSVKNAQDEHFTYRINSKENTDGTTVFFVALLTGPDNWANYTYMGMYSPETGEIRLTRASRYAEDSTPVKVARWAVKIVRTQGAVPAGYSIRHNGKCCRCGRMLTDPTSIERGIGPECVKEVGW